MHFVVAIKTLALLLATCSPALALPIEDEIVAMNITELPDWTPPLFEVDKRDLAGTSLSPIDERDLEKRIRVIWTITVQASYTCRIAGALSREQMYKVYGSTASDALTFASSITNSEIHRQIAANELSVSHRWQANFGNYACCYTLGHNLLNVGNGFTGWAPQLSNGPDLYEYCVNVQSGGCSSVVGSICPVSPGATFSRQRARNFPRV